MGTFLKWTFITLIGVAEYLLNPGHDAWSFFVGGVVMLLMDMHLKVDIGMKGSIEP